jgi:hypothetical protein
MKTTLDLPDELMREVKTPTLDSLRGHPRFAALVQKVFASK